MRHTRNGFIVGCVLTAVVALASPSHAQEAQARGSEPQYAAANGVDARRLPVSLERLQEGLRESVERQEQLDGLAALRYRIDVFGQPIASPVGETKDYGVILNTLNDRLTFKINWYETKLTNATLSGAAIDGSYLLGAGEAWGYMFAQWALLGVEFDDAE